MDYMGISVNKFLSYSFNHGNYIEVINNIPSNKPGNVYKTLWEGECETMDNYIPDEIQELEVVKWGIRNNGIVIYVNYAHISCLIW